MEELDKATLWWRCAYYAYLDSGLPGDNADYDEIKDRSISSLQDTVSEFIQGKWNFGTLKYRMDAAAVESDYLFPDRSIAITLSDLALGVPLDVLESSLRVAAIPPEDPGEAKGTLMDWEELMERAVQQGHLPHSQARSERWPPLLACLWHIQDPLTWPLVNDIATAYLRTQGEIGTVEPAHDYAEYASIMRRLSAWTGSGMTELEHLIVSLAENALSVPEAKDSFQDFMQRAQESSAQGLVEEALTLFERALCLRPATPEALRGKTALYVGKGLNMAAIGELEALVEIDPQNRADHRQLLTLYKNQNMAREYNIEVRRFKVLLEGRN